MSPSPIGASTALLAIDLGLRTGLAHFDRQGRLLRHASRHFGGRDALRRGAPTLLAELEGLEWLVLEGDGRLARAWRRPAEARGIQCLRVEPDTWRRALLLPRQRTEGSPLKREAMTLADRIVADSPASSPTPPGPDAAEAILIGLWACRQLGWPDAATPHEDG